MNVASKFKRRVPGTLISLAFAGLLLAGCATAPPPEDKEAVAAFKEANDPYEPFNRAMLDFNLALDKAILRPVTSVYLEVVPDPLQTNVHNFLQNLRGPVIFANDLLQGELDRAGTALLRFAMNSTFGILGINDFAAEVGIEKHDEDFGQTLAIWEVESGPYLVLPVFGPSSPRDGVGRPSRRRARRMMMGLTIIWPRIGPDPQQVGTANIRFTTSIPATTWPKAA